MEFVKNRISVISPIYKGVKYIPTLLKMIEVNCKRLQAKHPDASVEYIIINDYPDEPLPEIKSDTLIIKTITNEKNMGIQRTRIAGIRASTGEYLYWMDQDDLISSEILLSNFEHIKDNDIIICNGILEQTPKIDLYILRNNYFIKQVKRPFQYFYNHNQITPGMILFRKDAVDECWLNEPLKYNYCDDFVLWMLMFKNNKKFATNEEYFGYLHVNTGINTSLDSPNAYYAGLEAIEFYRKHNFDVDFHRMEICEIANKYFREMKVFRYIWLFIRHPIIVFNKVQYMIRVGIPNRRIKKAFKNSELKQIILAKNPKVKIM